MTETQYRHVKLRPEAYDALEGEAVRRYGNRNAVTWSALVRMLVEEAQTENELSEPRIVNYE